MHRSDLVLVDGDYEYEYALFDLEAVARVAAPGALVLIGNIDQGGPFLAAQDFLVRHSDWSEVGGHCLTRKIGEAFELRSQIKETNFAILKAPSSLTIDRRRPYTPGQISCGRTPQGRSSWGENGRAGHTFCTKHRPHVQRQEGG